MYYKLDENKNVLPCTLDEFSESNTTEWEEKYRVALDNINDKEISTVFVGIDLCSTRSSSPEPTNKPVVFETMIFNDTGHIYCTRCSTYDEALEMHKEAIKWVEEGCEDYDY